MKTFYRFLGRVWVICLVGCAAEPKADENNLKATGPFESRWAQQHDQVWLGADYWANPMEDWRILDGRIETVRPAVNRNVHLLSRRLGDRDGDLELSVRLGAFKPGAGSGGFRIGIQSELADPRSRLIHGRGGIDAGIGADGDLFIGRTVGPKLKPGPEGVRLRLRGEPAADGYLLMLTAHDREGRQLGGVFVDKVAPEKLVGNVALVNNFLKANVPGRKNNRAGKPRGRPGRFWFSHWRVSGSKFTAHPEDRFGPILFAQHTLSRGVLKMTAQMPPLDNQQPQRVALELKRDGRWAEAAQATIDPLARTARFRLEAWNGRISVPYRLVYESVNRLGERKRHTYGGTIRREPTDRDLKLAAFTGNTDQAFPNALLVSNVKVHDPDVLLFTGDQLYEQVGGYGIIREPVDRATLNYLRKWYVCGWAFRDLMRDRPTLFLTDDHDVYQGNIWGESGRDCGGIRGHARGGYAMPPKWVNMVQRTQTAHHPDPHDPTPIKRDIGVYYGDMLYGRVSFAILEDRKFKSGPQDKVNTWPGRPDHVRDPAFDPESVDKEGLVLLGERQLKFLRQWTADWRGADAKVVCSQTIFCNLANYHGPRQTYLVADLDSNGWPQTGRNKALEAIRGGYALMVAGDQHLASIVHHGIDRFGDAGVSFCVPSIAAGYPRSWRPDKEGRPVRNRSRGLANTGDYLDGLGNRMTVHAIGNPEPKNRPGILNTLHDKASGYGLVTFHKKTGRMTLACYRLQIDAADPKPSDQFPGWPMTVSMDDLYGRPAAAHLPTLHFAAGRNPVVQVIDQRSGKLLYTRRVFGDRFRPKVFDADGTYSLWAGEPGQMKVFKDLKPGPGRMDLP